MAAFNAIETYFSKKNFLRANKDFILQFIEVYSFIISSHK